MFKTGTICFQHYFTTRVYPNMGWDPWGNLGLLSLKNRFWEMPQIGAGWRRCEDKYSFFSLKSQALISGTHAWDPGDGWAADGGRVLGALLQIGGVDAGVPPCTRRRPWLGHLLFSDPQVSPLPRNFVHFIFSIKKVFFYRCQYKEIKEP